MPPLNSALNVSGIDLKNPDLDKIFKTIPGAQKAADGFIIGDEKAKFHVFGVLTEEQTEGLTTKETFYLPFCTKEEILRIRNQSSSSDYLLWLRAEAIADSPRAVRVFRKRAAEKKDWSLTKYYRDNFSYDKKYLEAAGKKFKSKTSNIPAGMAFVHDVNAMCIHTKFGNVIVANEALAFFLYYMNIVFFGRELGIDYSDISASLSIAIRIMMGSESLDFDIDSRGDLPPKIHKEIANYTEVQLIFIFGHEYAHHILGHLSSSSIKKYPLQTIMHTERSNIDIKAYSYEHKKEYSADLYAIKNIRNNNQFRSIMADSAFLMFIYFDILEHVLQYLALRDTISKTHPKPLDRLWHLRGKLKSKIGGSVDTIKSYLKFSDQIKNLLIKEWLPFRIDELERYGSIYLPSYKDKTLIDRIDF